MAIVKSTQKKYIGCTIKELPKRLWARAAETAISMNPANAPMRAIMPSIVALAVEGDLLPLHPGRIAVETTKYWGTGGVRLTVGFMEPVQTALRDRIISHMNAWHGTAGCNVSFTWTKTDPQVRITREGDGYWSFLGGDVLHIPKNQPTMSLQAFSTNTPESEFIRVVRHETGHTLGFVHEHLRRELVAKLDVQKTIAYFSRTQGWDEQTVREQVLTPVEESSLMGTPHADSTSIMCYALPSSITVDGQPIPGGADIDDVDKVFAQKLYPLSPPPPPGATKKLLIEFTGDYKITQQP